MVWVVCECVSFIVNSVDGPNCYSSMQNKTLTSLGRKPGHTAMTKEGDTHNQVN